MNRIITDHYKRITKKEAFNRYINGETIRLTAAKIHPENLQGVCIADLSRAAPVAVSRR